MITFEQFKKDWREKEAAEGTQQSVQTTSQGKYILPNRLRTDEELREIYNSMQSEKKTGVEHHGDIIGGGPVLTLKDVGH